MRKVLIGLAVVVVLLIGLDLVAGRILSDRIGAALQKKFSLSEQPSVSLSDPGLLIHLARGHIPSLHLNATTTASSGVAADIALDLKDVTFPRSVVYGGHGTVTIGSGTATAHIDQAEVQRLVAARLPEYDIKVAIDDAGIHANVSKDILGFSVGGNVTVKVEPAPGGVRLVPTAIDFPPELEKAAQSALQQSGVLDIALPLPNGATVTSASTSPGMLTVVATLGAVQIQV